MKAIGSTIRWGILGCGDVAEKKGGPALYQAAGSELVAVMRRDRAKAQDFARRHGAARAYDRVDDLLADSEIDAVYIATPPHLHAPQTFAAARAGKHVLVEKPMALNAKECRQMIEACADAGVQLHVAYYRRFWPRFVRLKQLVESGALGTILGARLLMCATAPANGWRVDPAISGGGHTVDVGSHRLDILVHVLGAPVEMSGFCANRLGHHAAENDLVLSWRAESGALGSAAFHFHTAPSRDVLEVYGSDATATCGPFDGPELIIRRRGEEPVVERFETPSPTHLPFVDALNRVYRGETIPHVDGVSGMQATMLLDSARSE